MLHSRIERVQHLLQSEIAGIIDQDLNDPNLPPLITVSEVKVSKDLSSALVFITLLEDQTNEVIQQTVTELNRCTPFIQKLLARRVHLKRHPRLKFTYSDTTRKALDLEHIFQQLKREESSMPAEPDSDPSAGQSLGDSHQTSAE